MQPWQGTEHHNGRQSEDALLMEAARHLANASLLMLWLVSRNCTIAASQTVPA